MADPTTMYPGTSTGYHLTIVLIASFGLWTCSASDAESVLHFASVGQNLLVSLGGLGRFVKEIIQVFMISYPYLM